MVAILECEKVTKTFKEPERSITVLEDITFSVHEREFVCIVGPSGCGKSTLLRLTMGLVPPTEGEIRYKGEPIRGVNPHMSMVFQTFALFPWLTVSENVEVGLEAMGVDLQRRRQKAVHVIEEVGLHGFEDAYPRELSGGMKQRVGIARALVTDPEVLLMDEPFSNLDTLTAGGLREELLRLWSDRTTLPEVIIMVTHNVEEAVYLADRILVLSRRPGRIVGDVPIDIPRPRDKRSNKLYEFVDTITSMIA